jgi:drug/metabolite transporter (DMT)-like permease
LRLIVNVARQRRWLRGIALAVAAYVLQALALALAPLAVVQPVLAAEIVFAVPLSVRLHHIRMGLREWAGVVAASGGLAGAILAAQPRPGDPLASVTAWVPVLAAAGALTVAAVLVGRSASGTTFRAACYALSAATMVGLESAFMAATARRFEDGAASGFTAWQTYAMALSSILSLVLIQSAFQAGPLAVSLPIIDAISPVVAISIGLLLFGERVAVLPWRLVVTCAGLLLLLAGIWALGSSPVVQRVHEQQESRKGLDDGCNSTRVEVPRVREPVR